MVSAITRTQAYTAETWMADWTLTALPAPLEPKKKVGAALAAFFGLSLALNKYNRLIINTSGNE